MENQNKNQYYLKEFKMFDGEYDITFNIVDINFDKQTVNIAISKAGKISVIEFDLKQSDSGYYFEYGPMLENIDIDDFENVEE